MTVGCVLFPHSIFFFFKYISSISYIDYDISVTPFFKILLQSFFLTCAKYLEHNTFSRGDHKKQLKSVRDIGDKAPFDKAPLEIRHQKIKRHVIDRKRKNKVATPWRYP
jgi:hypothetical protein